MEDMAEMLKQAYQGKRVMVTGHTGFKGSWLTIWLKHLGADVMGYALDPASERDNFLRSGIGSEIQDIRGDIRDAGSFQDAYDSFLPDTVFHLAAQPIVRDSYQSPVYTYEVNVMGTLNVLETIRKDSRKVNCIIVTSDKCYENREWVWGYKESDAMGGFDPYSSSKGCAELLTASYQRSFFPPERFSEHGKNIATVRAGNVIGGGDWAKDRIIPDCIRALEHKEKILIRSPKAVRPWQHVLEPLSGYLKLGARMEQSPGEYSSAWNFGPNQTSVIPVEKIVQKIILEWGSGDYDILDSSNSGLHEASLLNLDISKANYLLDWRPQWNIDQTIYQTCAWYRNYDAGNVLEMDLQQIEAYMKLQRQA